MHVIVAGESLWSIASEQLGPDASNADIARTVHRLWELNAKVIATGDPDLVPSAQSSSWLSNDEFAALASGRATFFASSTAAA